MARRGTTVLAAVVAFAAAAFAAPAGASAAGCPGQGDARAAAAAQERAMLCLVNQARRQRGLSPLAAPGSLARSAARKSADMLRCDQFSHEACGREFDYWIEEVGYRGCSTAENIAYASGNYATPRTIFKLWMNSAGHRRNILGSFDDIGIGLQVGRLKRVKNAHVWTQQFGGRC